MCTYPNDIPLIRALLSRAETEDGIALIEAFKKGVPDIVYLILDHKTFSVDILNEAFREATKWDDQKTRGLACSRLLKAGASGEVVSGALMTAALDGDIDFGYPRLWQRPGGDLVCVYYWRTPELPQGQEQAKQGLLHTV